MARRAFVMGFNGPEELGSLRFARDDAETMLTALQTYRCGYEIARPEVNTTASMLRQELFDFAGNCEAKDTFICFFSDHGVLEKGKLYLVLDATDPRRVWSTALPISDVLTALENCGATNKLLILDCCHAGGAVGFKGTIPVTELNIEADNHLVLMASGRLERARELDELNGSFLTKKISEALTEGFHQADKDHDFRISIEDLMSWLEDCTLEHNRQSASKVPVPYLFGQKKGEFYLTADNSNWTPFEMPFTNETTIVILPIAPRKVTSKLGKNVEVVYGISKYPVTNLQYKNFLTGANNHGKRTQHFSEPQEVSVTETERLVFYPWQDALFNAPNQPVVCVSYIDARRYCEWLEREIRSTAGSSSYAGFLASALAERNLEIGLPPYRLWDFAAFGTEFPLRRSATWLSQTQEVWHSPGPRFLRQEEKLSPAQVEEGTSRTNSRGISDLIGNIWEWCGEHPWKIDFDGPPLVMKPFGEGFPVVINAGIHLPPQYPFLDGQHVFHKGRTARIRGGGYSDDLTVVEPFLVANALKNGGETKRRDLGFRVSVRLAFHYLPEPIQLQLRLCHIPEYSELVGFDTSL